MIPCMHELATNCGLLTSVALLVVMSLMWKMCVDVQFSSLDFSNAMGHRRSLLRTKMYVLLLLHSSPCHTEFCTGFFGSSSSCCMHSYPCFGERVFLNLFSACLIQWASRQFLQYCHSNSGCHITTHNPM